MGKAGSNCGRTVVILAQTLLGGGIYGSQGAIVACTHLEYFLDSAVGEWRLETADQRHPLGIKSDPQDNNYHTST